MAKASPGMDVSKMATEGFGQMMNSMDFFKRAWSNLATPFTPTLDVEELDKRITDLKAVEQWLSLNQNLLRSTIQGLEIQRGTLDAFNTVTNSFGNAMKPSDDSIAQSLARHAAAAAQKAVEPPPAPAESKGGSLFRPFDWSPFGMPSSLLPGFHAAAPSRAQAGGEGGKASGAGAGADRESGAGAQAGDGTRAGAGGETGAGAAAGTGGLGGEGAGAGSERAMQEAGGGVSGAEGDEQSGASGEPAAGGSGSVPGMNPLAWWEMLQQNFRQIAQAATGDFPGSSSGNTSGAGADKARARGAGGAAGGGRGSRSGGAKAASTRKASGAADSASTAGTRGSKAKGTKGSLGAGGAGTAAKRKRSKGRADKDPG